MGGPLGADDAFEVTEVALREFGGAVGEEDEVGHRNGAVVLVIDLGHVEELEGVGTATERSGRVFNGVLEQAIEGAGANAVVGAIANGLNGLEELADVELLFR